MENENIEKAKEAHAMLSYRVEEIEDLIDALQKRMINYRTEQKQIENALAQAGQEQQPKTQDSNPKTEKPKRSPFLFRKKGEK